MALVAFPLDNTDYTASAMGAYLGTRTRGVFSADGNLAVTANGNMTVTVGAGLAWLLAADYWGLAVCADGDTVLIIPAASGTLSRIDAVCMRLDKTANAAELVVKQGAAASSPVLPAIVRNDSYDEIYLAAVSVPAGAVSITAADITDLRLDEDVCGLMRDGVTGIPTAQLQEQAEALMEQLRSDIDAASSGVGISVYTHSKSGTVHALTGGGPNGRVLMTAEVAEGDTVTVNGKAMPAYVGAEDFAAALAGQTLDGRWLTFVFDGTQVNFKGGGGAVTVEGLAAENIVAGQTVTVKQGAKTVAQVEGSCPPGGLFVWTDTAHPDLQVTAADTPCFTVEGAAVTVRKPCTLRLTAAMMTHTSVNSTTTHTARFVKNGEAVCIAVATGTGAVPARGVQTAAVAVQAGDVVHFEATAGYPNNQMAFGCLTVE